MSQTTEAQKLAEKVVQKLQNITDEETIKSITLESWKKLQESIPNPNSFKRPGAAFRKVVESAFPSGNDPKPGFYKTSAGKEKEERYEHLALWYCTTNTKRWDVVGDAARAEYWGNLPPLPEKQPDEQPQPISQAAQTEEPIEKSKTAKKSTLTLKDMTLEQLELDSETQQIVSDALNHSGMSLADFIKQACKVYAKTVTGKAKQSEDDLSNVSTEELLNPSQVVNGKEIRTKYYTHPGRAEELTKRAIVAIQRHNDNAPEKDQRWMITQTSLQSLTGSRPATIKKIIEQYKGMIDDHNNKYGLNPYDNRKGGDRKIENEINFAQLVPDGLDL
ncbi:hypothetical protein SD81_032650 [Tolypothrix campylonemoides VB511288]|nr:hypothetical protein SD81_032650 [Tolypothrix campylonemoides VB511288]